jgi:O-acetylhomoserine (thiol)-lyase
MNSGFTTKAVHGTGAGKDIHRALRPPVYDGAAFDFASAEIMADAFSGRKAAHAYTRITNPTVEDFERTVNSLEAGLGTVAVSSGMAAISATFLNLLVSGENIVSASSIFGGTYSLFTNVLAPFGVETRFVPSNDIKAITDAIDADTRVIYLETISNPCMVIPDISAISAIAREKGIVLIADSTVTTPYLFKAKNFGVNVVIHSTTKYFSGGATSVGGVIVDLGNFDWAGIPALKAWRKFGEFAFIARLRKEVCRETGGCLSPHNAFLQRLGAETLALRLDKICGNAQKIAEFLESHDLVATVCYPGLESSPYHYLALKQFGGRSGGILSFRLKDRDSCFRFLNNLKIISRSTNLGDNKTLALHPASTIFSGMTGEELTLLGVDDKLIRISAGIEDITDITTDIDNALKGVQS